MSTYQQSFSRAGPEDVRLKNSEMRELGNKSAGLSTNYKNIEGIQMTSVLTGEQYRDFEDPQQNTHIQKTWVYGGDRTMNYADENLQKTLDDMGGQGTTQMIMNHYRKSRLPENKIGDGQTSIPVESKFLD